MGVENFIRHYTDGKPSFLQFYTIINERETKETKKKNKSRQNKT